MESFVQSVAMWALPVLAAIILHEIAHGWVANLLGDPTAKAAGRLTLNPLPHIDPIGTIGLPLLLLVTHAPFLFGYARPVPVNFNKLYRPKRDMIFVAAAGPLTNLILAVISALVVRTLFNPEVPLAHQSFLTLMALRSVTFNVVIAVFNMLPILPLDGGRVLTGLLPMRQAVVFSRMEPFGMIIVLMLMATNALGQVIGPVVHVMLKFLL